VFDQLFDKVIVINLPDSARRREHIAKHFLHHRVRNYEFIPAVDGAKLDLCAMQRDGVVEFDDWKKRHLTPGEVGCYLSHVRAWHTALHRSYSTVLICEDDVEFLPNAEDLICTQMRQVPADWDIIHFYSQFPVGCGRCMDGSRQIITANIWRGANEGAGAVCYALSARGAEFLDKSHLPIKYALDGVTARLTRTPGYGGYIVHPLPCRLARFPSDIDARGSRSRAMPVVTTVDQSVSVPPVVPSGRRLA
jgi:glycosyl transferase, family 25